MARITIIVSDDTKVALEKKAKEEECNVSYLVRKAIKKYFDEDESAD